jgi:hypothetical protein
MVTPFDVTDPKGVCLDRTCFIDLLLQRLARGLE